MCENTRYQSLKKASLVTILVNGVLAALKTVVGLAGNSMAVVSDGVHTMSDVFTTVIVMLGVRFSSAEADKGHPYGHQRIESLVSLLLAFLLGFSALYLGWRGIQGYREGIRAERSLWAIAVTVASIAVKEWMFRYTKKKAEKYHSTAMLSDAWHHRSDAASSVAVLIGIGGVYLGIWFLEPLATLVVCLIILKAAFEIGMAAVAQLIDQSVDEERYRQLYNLALSVEGVRRIDLMNTRISNHVVFVDIEVVVDKDLSVAEGHAIAQEVHDLLEGEDLSVEHCMVHVHPTA